jgi:hypothetical protein
MALQKLSLAVPFEGGVETKLDPKRVPAAKLLRLENAVFRRDLATVSGNGTNALCKRNGYEALADSGLAQTYTPRAMGVRGDELLMFTDDRCYSYSDARSTWDDTGAAISASITDRVVAKNGAEQTTPDSYALDGVRVVAWAQAGGIWWAAIDDATGRVLRAPAELAAAGQSPRVCRCGALLHIYWADAAAGALMAATVTPNNLTATPAPAMLTDTLSPTYPAFDVVECTGSYNDVALIGWQRASGYGGVSFVHSTGVLGGPGLGLPSPVTTAGTMQGGIAVAFEATEPLCAIAGVSVGTGVALELMGGSLAVERGDIADLAGTIGRVGLAFDTDVDATSGRFNLYLTGEVEGATVRDNSIKTFLVTDDGAALDFTAQAIVRGVGLASTTCIWNGEPFAWLCHDVNDFSVYLMTRLSDGLVVARYLPSGAAYGLPSGLVVGGAIVADGVATWAAAYNEVVTEGTGIAKTFTETGIRLAAVDFEDAAAHQSGQLGGCLYLGGACVQQYDGQRWAEAGYHYAPDETTSALGAGGALTPSRSYLYGICYEETNAQGEVDRGPVAFLLATTGVSDTRVTLTIPTYRLTGRTGVRLAVFRSVGNDAAALYRVTSLDPAATTGSNRYIPNDTTVDTLTFVDDLSDALLIAAEPLYMNGGIPSNDPVAGGAVLVVGKGRVFTTDPVDPLLVRYSQQLADGYGVEFVPQLGIKVDPFGGPITALAVLDDKLVVFKRDAVFVVSGMGPAAAPDLDRTMGFTDAQLVTSDAGCARAESIAHCPVGLVFQSSKGIYLLGRDLQLQYIGASVEAFNAQTVRRATLVPDRTHVVFVVEDGVTLLWDYYFGQWSTFTNHAGLDAAVVGGRYHYLRTDGRVFRETPGVFRDDNSHIRRTIETAWLRFGEAIQGFQRIYHAHFVGRYVSPHTLRVRCQADYEDSWSNVWDVTVSDSHTEANYGDGLYGAGVYGGAASVRYQERIHVGKKCQAIRFQIQDVEGDTEYGGAFELSELLITGGRKGPAAKVGTARSS